MNFSKLPTIAAFTALCLTACSEETGVAADAIDGISGNEIPGGEFPGSSAMFPGGDIPGSSAIFPRSSSSSPWHQYSSGTVNPGGNESGDDENDLEDARTLNGTQILLKLAGTTTAGTAPAARSQYAAFSESGGHIVVSGGYRYISAKGNMVDVFDANGSGKMTGGVLLAFGNFSTDLPKCATVTYNNSSYYGSNNAAFKPTYQGNAIIYGGSVTSVAQVQTNGMTEVKFPNGVSYMYK